MNFQKETKERENNTSIHTVNHVIFREKTEDVLNAYLI